jgi:two-component system OmpR family sensor kinase
MTLLPNPVDSVAARELLTVAAHDLRNHLTPLQVRLDLIRRRALRDDQPEYLHDSEQAARNLDRLRRLIADLLDVSRLDRGMFSVHARAVDLSALIAESIEAFAEGDTVVQLTQPATLTGFVDPERFQQALENLLANAVHHSPDHGVVCVLVSESGSWIHVQVSDQGPGIPADLQAHLFDAFAIGPGSVGLGLGLFLAQGIAVAHGGLLRVDSNPGKGATFTLALPALLPEA